MVAASVSAGPSAGPLAAAILKARLISSGKPIDLRVTLCGISLRNPIIAASGTFGYGVEFERIFDLRELGAIVTKGLSREPLAGNPAPRLWHTEGGMMNSIGLQNVGVRSFIADKLPKLRRHDVPVIANVFGYSLEDYVYVVKALNDAEGMAGYELNVSCPNTKAGGIFFSSDPSALARLLAAVRPAATRPLIVKLSPNVSSVRPFAEVVKAEGADALSLVNTFVSLAVNPWNGIPRLGNTYGGLSGPAIKPIALRLVAEAVASCDLPVVGIGGISNGRDVLEFMRAGATAIEVGTASFIDPRAPSLIRKHLVKEMGRLGIPDLSSIRGRFGASGPESPSRTRDTAGSSAANSGDGAPRQARAPENSKSVYPKADG